jgi:hypothetical protein
MNDNKLNEQNIKDLMEVSTMIDSNISNSFKNILIQYSYIEWSNWIEDILNYGIAYPIYNITSNGDDIVEIINYFRTNDISSINYETAVINTIHSFSYDYSNPVNLERLLNALIIIRSNRSEAILVKIVTSRDNNHTFGKNEYIKTRALLALARAAENTDINKEIVFNYICMVGIKEMKHDPAFYGNVLRYCYLQFSIDKFYFVLELLLNELNPISLKVENKSLLVAGYSRELVDKLDELHFRDISRFYSTFCSWYISYNLRLIENNDDKNTLTTKVIHDFSEHLNIYISSLDLEGHDVKKSFNKQFRYNYLDEILFGKALKYLFDIEFEKRKNIFNVEAGIELTAFLFDQMGTNIFIYLSKTYSEHNYYISERFGIAPYIAESVLSDLYSDDIIWKVQQCYDEAIYLLSDKQVGSIIKENRNKGNKFDLNNYFYGRTQDFIQVLNEKEDIIVAINHLYA